MKKRWIILSIILAFLFGLTWQIDMRSPYYEARGVFRIRQRLLGVEYIYTWADKGFDEKYPPDWNIRRYNSFPW